MSYSLKVPEDQVFGKGKFVNAKGNAECVEFVRQATGAPQTSAWTKGIAVKGAEAATIAKHTAIATFDDAGKYPTDELGQHAAVYLSHDETGVVVLDQWKKQGEVLKRTIRFNRTGERRSNNGDTFYVIE